MQYDGAGKLGEVIAALYGCSPRNNNKIAELIQQAKDELGITSKSKHLPDDMKLAIYRWHYERLNPVQNVKQGGSVQDDDVQSLDDTLVQDVKQSDDDKLDLLPNNAVYNVKHNVPVQADDVIDSSVYDFKQIHFAVTFAHCPASTILSGLTTITLSGFS